MAYRSDILEELAALGVVPHPDTPPAVVKDHVSDLYCYELRRLRARLLAGGFPRHEYAARVLDVRTRYFLLSIPIDRWTEPRTGDRS